MAVIAVLAVLAAVLYVVFYWSGRYGDKNRNKGTSLRRGARAHTTRTGQPKKGYASRDEAQAHATQSSKHNGAPMGAYKCATCDKWHIGHG
jgi:hypothetical protein